MEHKQRLIKIYNVLNEHFGDLHWWPGESKIEIIIGAILTQNTAWRNVEIAIGQMRHNGLLDPSKLFQVKNEILEASIRPSGYYRIKTQRLKAFIQFLFEHYDGSLERLFDEDIQQIRRELLLIKGIGEETADSIILYAGEKPVFVIDAYTRRILERHLLIDGKETYGEIQTLFMQHLPKDVQLFKQYHALIVNTGKIFCSKKPKCDGCPLHRIGG